MSKKNVLLECSDDTLKTKFWECFVPYPIQSTFYDCFSSSFAENNEQVIIFGAKNLNVYFSNQTRIIHISVIYIIQSRSSFLDQYRDFSLNDHFAQTLFLGHHSFIYFHSSCGAPSLLCEIAFKIGQFLEVYMNYKYKCFCSIWERLFVSLFSKQISVSFLFCIASKTCLAMSLPMLQMKIMLMNYMNNPNLFSQIPSLTCSLFENCEFTGAL